MENMNCGVVVIARDEEKVIEKCLESLRRQTVEIFLVLVDDGSEDRTKKFASHYTDVIVNLTRHDENWTGTPKLANVFNAGFELFKEKSIDYLLISGADAVYPPTYLENVIKRMSSNDVVLASGIAENEASRSTFPRGCGRVIDAEWFRDVGFRYPENHGFEGYLIYKALSQDKYITVYPDLGFKLLRKTQTSNRKLFSWGRGMKALNYWWLYAFGRTIKIGLTNPVGGYNMLMGYLSNVLKYDDLKEFVPRYQRKFFMKRLKKTSFN